MRREITELVDSLSPEQVRDITANLLKKEKEKTRSMAIPIASLLAVQMKIIGRPDLEKSAQFILDEILKPEKDYT